MSLFCSGNPVFYFAHPPVLEFMENGLVFEAQPDGACPRLMPIPVLQKTIYTQAKALRDWHESVARSRHDVLPICAGCTGRNAISHDGRSG